MTMPEDYTCEVHSKVLFSHGSDMADSFLLKHQQLHFNKKPFNTSLYVAWRKWIIQIDVYFQQI